MMIGGCATARIEILDATLRAYERNIRWSEFRTAFALAGQADAPLPDFQRLQNVRVTSYEKVDVNTAQVSDTKISQTIEIRYVHLLNMNERVYTDQQTWVYTEADQRWRLSSPFPTFR
jgi:hypothetical protein